MRISSPEIHDLQAVNTNVLTVLKSAIWRLDFTLGSTPGTPVGDELDLQRRALLWYPISWVGKLQNYRGKVRLIYGGAKGTFCEPLKYVLHLNSVSHQARHSGVTLHGFVLCSSQSNSRFSPERVWMSVIFFLHSIQPRYWTFLFRRAKYWIRIFCFCSSSPMGRTIQNLALFRVPAFISLRSVWHISINRWH